MGSHINGDSAGGPAPAEAEAQSILDAIREIVRVLRESSRAAEAKVGLSGAQLFVLQKLGEGGPLSLNELAARTLTHQSSVSVVVSRLVEAGLVQRRRAEDDARRLELALTRQGEQLLSRAPDAAQERLIQGVRELSATDRKRLAQGLKRLLERMGVEERTPEMFFEEPPKAKGKGSHG